MNMLMEIDPLLMRGSLVMMMSLISPSGSEVSPAEQLRRSSRLVLPKFHHETAVLRPESSYMIFSKSKPFIQHKMGTGGLPGGPQACRARPGGIDRTPWLVTSWWVPSGTSFAHYFLYIPKQFSVTFQDFWSCAEQVSQICSFSVQNSSC